MIWFVSEMEYWSDGVLVLREHTSTTLLYCSNSI